MAADIFYPTVYKLMDIYYPQFGLSQKSQNILDQHSLM